MADCLQACKVIAIKVVAAPACRKKRKKTKPVDQRGTKDFIRGKRGPGRAGEIPPLLLSASLPEMNKKFPHEYKRGEEESRPRSGFVLVAFRPGWRPGRHSGSSSVPSGWGVSKARLLSLSFSCLERGRGAEAFELWQHSVCAMCTPRQQVCC